MENLNFTCNRRKEFPVKFEEKKDTRIKHGDDRCCSYCGSLHPDDVISKIEIYGFGVIGRTSKKYKWYIGVNSPVIIPDLNASNGGIKFYHQHKTPEFVERFNELFDLKNN